MSSLQNLKNRTVDCNLFFLIDKRDVLYWYVGYFLVCLESICLLTEVTCSCMGMIFLPAYCTWTSPSKWRPSVGPYPYLQFDLFPKIGRSLEETVTPIVSSTTMKCTVSCNYAVCTYAVQGSYSTLEWWPVLSKTWLILCTDWPPLWWIASYLFRCRISSNRIQ